MGGGEPGHLGWGYETCGPREPRIPAGVPNIGDIGVDRPFAPPNAGLFDGPNDWFVWEPALLLKGIDWAREPETIVGGERGAHGNGGW